MKKILLIPILVALITSCGTSTKIAKTSFPTVNQNGKIAIVAHRGFWNCEESGFSQNSIASISRAQQIEVWGSECDIHLTSDGKIIVNHDPDIEGLDINKTAFETLSAKLLKNGERHPDFASYVDQAAKHTDKTILVCEIKKQSSPQMEDELVEKAFATLKEKGMFDPAKVIFISFSLHVCQKIAAEAPLFTNQYLNGDLSPAKVASYGINGIDYKYSVLSLNPQWVKEAHDLGMSVNVWTVNKEEKMKEAIGWGVDAITTNEPLLLRELIKNNEYKK